MEGMTCDSPGHCHLLSMSVFITIGICPTKNVLMVSLKSLLKYICIECLYLYCILFWLGVSFTGPRQAWWQAPHADLWCRPEQLRAYGAWCTYKNQEWDWPYTVLPQIMPWGNLRILRHEYWWNKHPCLYLVSLLPSSKFNTRFIY